MSTASRDLRWFARHEALLAWRDAMAILRGRGRSAAIVTAIIALILHGIAYVIISPFAATLVHPDKRSIVVIMSASFLSWMLMLSQAMEAATRSFYARGDLDLILSSPFAGRSVFLVRIVAIFFSTMAMALGVLGAFIDMAAILITPVFLSAYLVLFALGMIATGIAVLLTVVLFQLAGPKRTRFFSQIVSAIAGAGFVIAIQLGAVLSYHNLSSLKVIGSDRWVAMAPGLESPVWLPVFAARGDMTALFLLLAGALAFFCPIAWHAAGQFARNALLIAANPAQQKSLSAPRALRVRHPHAALVRKEWKLLARDPWLLSQCLMQILYLIPPAFMLQQSFHRAGGAALLVPVIVLAAGQLAGGLAWLAISAEDAPDLVASAPVSAAAILRAKIQAVLVAVAFPVLPLCVAMALTAPFAAIIMLCGVITAAASSCVIQLLFKVEGRRAHFRRRQTSSRFATFAEALIATLIAAAAGLLAAHHNLIALAPLGLATLILLLISRFMRPKQRHIAP